MHRHRHTIPAVRSFHLGKDIDGIAITPDEKTIACAYDDGSPDGKFVLINTSTGVRRLVRVEGSIPTFSQDGSLMVTGEGVPYESKKFWIYVWRYPRIKLLLRIRRKGPIYAGSTLAFSPDGQTIASMEQDTLYLYDAHTGRIRRSLPANILGVGASAPVYSADGRYLAVCSEGEGYDEITVWEVRTGRHWQLDNSLVLGDTASTASSAMFFLPGDRTLITGGGRWDFRHKGKRLRLKPLLNASLPDGFYGPICAGPPLRVVTRSLKDETLCRLWDVSSRRRLLSWHVPREEGRDCQLSSHGRFVVYANGGTLVVRRVKERPKKS